jgi:hypothetical protein
VKADQPGALQPDADVKELRAAVEELRKTVDLLTHMSRDPRPSAVNAHRRTAFIVMPFGIEDLEVVYEDFIKPTIEQCELDCVRGDDIVGSDVIMEDIRSAISASGLIVADLTGQNANVFYEVGIAHAIEKPVLLLAQSLDDVPFDLRHRRVLLYEYSPPGVKRLEQRLKEHVLEMMSRTSKQE